MFEHGEGPPYRRRPRVKRKWACKRDAGCASRPHNEQMHVVVVGAGLAGLSAAVELLAQGNTVTVVEASDGPGGRVRTDDVDGYKLDRGFQVLLTAYPDAQEILDYGSLDLHSFRPGARVRVDDRFVSVADPFREPGKILDSVRAPIGSPLDKARILAFRLTVSRGTVDDVWNREDVTARTRFTEFGFSDEMIERFLRPLFAGITLDPDLGGSSRAVDFVFRMLGEGSSAVPRNGMGEIATQLAKRIPAESLRLNTSVDTVADRSVTAAGGEILQGDAVILATGATEAARLASTPDPGWRGVTSLWLATHEPVVDEPVLMLNGNGVSPINSVAAMSSVSPGYAPDGKHSLVVSCPSLEDGLLPAMRTQLREWFGSVADTWQEMRVDRIAKAQPVQLPGYDARAPLKLEDGLWICGDHRRDASINGALASGRSVARALLSA